MTEVNQMDALGLLISHRSASRLAEPVPTSEQLQNILCAGMRVPDHKSIQPWHSFMIKEEGHERLSAVLEQRATTAGSNNKTTNKVRNAPFRAPLIITVVAKCEENRKVLCWKQEMPAGCVTMTVQVATVTQGFGGIWYSDALTESPVVREALGCHEQDKVIGFLYPGTPQLKVSMPISIPSPTPFVTYL